MVAEMVRAEVERALARVDSDGYLSTREAAERAKVHPGTIRRWVREGRLARRGAGSRLRVRVDDLERLLATSRDVEHGATPEALARRDFG